MAAPPTSTTDAAVRAALEEADAEKKKKRRRRDEGDDGAGPSSSNRQRQQPEGEGVPCDLDDTERLVRHAQKRRAARRRGLKGDIDDDDLELGALENAEEGRGGADADEPGGESPSHVPFTAFNLDEERATGHFDEDGNYFEGRRGGKDDDDEEEEEAWLEGAEVAHHLADDVMRRRREEAAEAAAPAPPSDLDVARMNADIASLLQPGETVKRAFIRLGRRANPDRGGASAKSSRGLPPGLRKRTARRDATGGREGGEEGDAKAAFDRLTAVATRLMDCGELDVYERTQEEFARAASLFLPMSTPAAGAGPSAAAATAAAGGGDDDDDDDMFADDDDEGGAPAVASGGEGPSTNKAAPIEEDYAAWKVGDLKRLLVARGGDPTGITEKDDLVARVKKAVGAAGNGAAGPQNHGATVPPGYVMDAPSGYLYSAQDKLYYDPNSGYYFDGAKWFTKA